MSRRSAAGLLALSAALAIVASCERTRTRNSVGGVSAEAEVAPTTNVYRFVGVEKALRDARKAVAEERWADAQAAARALLAKEPSHIEATNIAARAELEGRSQAHFTTFQKGLSDRSPATIATSYQGIDPQSRYRELARPDYERVREQWAVAREAEVRNLARAGRCRQAHRIARLADDMFSEMRSRLLAAGDNCNPATRDEDDAPAPSPPVASLAPVPTHTPPPAPAPPPSTPAPAITSTSPVHAPVPVAAAVPVPPKMTTAMPAPPVVPAVSATPPSPKPSVPPAISEEGRKKLLRDYIAQKVQPRIKEFFEYPRGAELNNEEGTVIVQLTIASNGNLLAAKVSGACPHTALCDAALANAHSASPYPPPPAILATEVNVLVRFQYTLEQ